MLLTGIGLSSAVSADTASPWVVYYSDKEPLSAFDPYGLVVLDSTYHPPIAPLRDPGKLVLGYISLGEVENWRAWFDEVRDEGILIEENPNWPGSWTVDARDGRWARRVIEDIIPQILRKGFDGLFFDTLDNLVYLEERDRETYAGMQDAAARLVRGIRRHYPDLTLVMNRGYALIPQVGLQIDMVLGESVYTDYDFENKTYHKVDPELYQTQVALLQNARRQFPRLRILTLDYWHPDDEAMRREIYQVQRANGFEPYVSTVELNRIVPELLERAP